jgi:hypothetical protein
MAGSEVPACRRGGQSPGVPVCQVEPVPGAGLQERCHREMAAAGGRFAKAGRGNTAPGRVRSHGHCQGAEILKGTTNRLTLPSRHAGVALLLLLLLVFLIPALLAATTAASSNAAIRAALGCAQCDRRLRVATEARQLHPKCRLFSVRLKWVSPFPAKCR